MQILDSYILNNSSILASDTETLMMDNLVFENIITNSVTFPNFITINNIDNLIIKNCIIKNNTP